MIHTYIPPEAVGGQNLTSKSDMWNLGMLLFELFSNRPLFKVPSKDYDLGLADQILNVKHY